MRIPTCPSVIGEHRGFVVCTTQRTGSNYLCQLLSSTGVLGKPLDYFNVQGRRSKGWSDYPDDRERQLEIIVSNAATENGIYGFKLFAYDLDTLTILPWTEYLPNLNWIFLHRADLLGQAISLTLAKQTDQWRSTDGVRVATPYDASVIDRELASISRDNADWCVYFARNALNPLVLKYEDLVEAPEIAVQSIARLLGIECRPIVDWSKVDVTIQRDETDTEWRTRYVADRSNFSLFRRFS